MRDYFNQFNPEELFSPIKCRPCAKTQGQGGQTKMRMYMLADGIASLVEKAGRFLRFKGSFYNALEHRYYKLASANPCRPAKSIPGIPVRPLGDTGVSVVILTLDGAGLLEKLFKSIAEKNTCTNLEILVVNHGTDVETQDCVKEWEKCLTVKEVRLMRNYSFAYSCNRAAEVAQGDILVFLNNDIQLEEDFIPAVSAAVEHCGGLVGMKLYHPTKNNARGRHHHIGVRFRWNIRQYWTAPYNATPFIADAELEKSPARMPAVTAAVLGCHRNTFLEIGGFFEQYVYAYEDVDLCLKYRLGNKGSVMSLNNIAALHGEGETRIKRSSSRQRQAWHRYNSRIFRERFGPALRRDLYANLFGGDANVWGRLPLVGLAACDKRDVPAIIREELSKNFALAVSDHVPNLRGYNLFALDLLLSFSPVYLMKRARHSHPAMISAACFLTGDQRWDHICCDSYDLLLAINEKLAEEMSRRLGRPVKVLDVETGDVVGQLRDALIGFTRFQHKISLKANTGTSEVILKLKQALERRGHKVRIDGPKRWNSLSRVRDDVVLWCRSPRQNFLQEGSVNIALFNVENLDTSGYDAAVDIEGAADILAIISQLDRVLGTVCPRRTAPPTDAPLPDRRTLFGQNLQENWLLKEDPVRMLLDESY